MCRTCDVLGEAVVSKEEASKRTWRTPRGRDRSGKDCRDNVGKDGAAVKAAIQLVKVQPYQLLVSDT